MKLQDICRKADINCPAHLENIEIAGITSDSKNVAKDYIFVCLLGTKTDGHHHIDNAIVNGASVVVVERKEYLSENAILVENTRVALSHLMNAFCGEPTKELRFIGITGTNGKTSTSVMIKNILDKNNTPCEVIGTLNCSSFSPNTDSSKTNFTTPDPEELYPMLRRISDAGIKTVVMETSSHALALDKLDPINFEIGIFTNLTEDHLDFHHTMEDYFKSKLRLFNKCRVGIINIDDEYGKKIIQLAPCKIKTCSMSGSADYLAENIKILGESGTEYTLKTKDDEISLACTVPGIFSVMNSMQASACALELEIDKNIVKRSVKSFNGVKGRLEKLEFLRGWGFAVFIDYAHTPDALSKLIATANSFKREGERVVLLFGCGGDREKEKRKIMGKIATESADFVIITSDNPRSENPNAIINDILCGVGEAKNYVVIPDRKNAIEYAVAMSREGDIILLAGKGHENYEINASGKHPFDEREVVRRAFDKYYGRRKEDMSYEN